MEKVTCKEQIRSTEEREPVFQLREQIHACMGRRKKCSCWIVVGGVNECQGSITETDTTIIQILVMRALTDTAAHLFSEDVWEH